MGRSLAGGHGIGDQQLDMYGGALEMWRGSALSMGEEEPQSGDIDN